MAAVFTHTVQMRFSDTDSMGHVNNARFLTYLEDARIGFLTAIGADGEDFMGNGLIVARITIDYVRPILYNGDAVRVEAWVTRIGTKSFGVDYAILQGENTVANATSVLVAYDYAAGASRPLTEAERAALTHRIDS